MAWALSFNGVDEWAAETAGLGVTLTGEYEVIFKYNFISGPGKIADSVSSANRWDIQFSGGAGLDARTYMTWDVDGVNEGDIPTGVPFTLKVYRTPTQTDQTDKNFATLCARFNFITPLPCEIESIEINNGVGGTDYFFSATDSDHNTSPPVLIDTLGTGVTFTGNSNMTDVNWIDLGGGDNSLTVTEDSIFTISDTTITTSTSSVAEDSELAFDDTSDLLVTASLIENSEITLSDTSDLASKTAIIDSSEVGVVDTTTVVFRTSGNSLITTEDNELSTVDSTIVAFRSIINESTELSSVDTTLNYFPAAVIEDGVFSVSNGTITAFSSRIVENSVLELVDTTVVNFPSGDFNPIIGLTLELSSAGGGELYSSIEIEVDNIAFGFNPKNENIVILTNGESNEH